MSVCLFLSLISFLCFRTPQKYIHPTPQELTLKFQTPTHQNPSSKCQQTGSAGFSISQGTGQETDPLRYFKQKVINTEHWVLIKALDRLKSLVLGCLTSGIIH